MSRIIDADNTVRTICGYYCGCERDECRSDDPCEAVAFIEDSPTVSDDEVREAVCGVGEWIKNNDGVCWWWECSECHEQPLQRYKYDRLSSFCPSCGARMKGAEKAMEVSE